MVKTISGMAQNFIAVDREQVLLMPPSLREWLPEDHFAWFVLATVERLDLSAFYRAYRPDGHGRAASRSAVDGRRVVLLVLAWVDVLAGDRAGVCGGRRGAGWWLRTRRLITRRSHGFVCGTRTPWRACLTGC